MNKGLGNIAVFAFIAIFSINAAAQEFRATDMRPGGNPTVLTEAHILKNTAQTFCLIHQVTDKAELEDKTFRNNMIGTLSIDKFGRGGMGGQMLTFDASLDNKFPIQIADEFYLLVMEKTGDQIDIEGGILGVGAKLRFEAGRWIALLGQHYRNGGVTFGNQGLELLEGTEKRNESPTQQSPQSAGTLQGERAVAESDLPGLEESLIREIRNKGVDNRFVINEIMPQGGLPGSMTLVQPDKDTLSAETEFPGDGMPIVNNQPFAFGNFCLHRFKGRVELILEGNKYTFISEDDKLNRLTFVLVPRIGYVYLRGKGRVTLKDGSEVKLGEGNSTAEELHSSHKRVVGLLFDSVPPDIGKYLDKAEGAIVNSVQPGSLSEEAGFKGRNGSIDIIIEANGSKITEARDLLDIFRGLNTGEKLHLTFIRLQLDSGNKTVLTATIVKP